MTKLRIEDFLVHTWMNANRMKTRNKFVSCHDGETSSMFCVSFVVELFFFCFQSEKLPFKFNICHPQSAKSISSDFAPLRCQLSFTFFSCNFKECQRKIIARFWHLHRKRSRVARSSQRQSENCYSCAHFSMCQDFPVAPPAFKFLIWCLFKLRNELLPHLQVAD